MTLTQHKQQSRKTWARIAAELSEQAMKRDPDRMRRIFEGRLYKLLGGAVPHEWEALALADLLGEGCSYNALD